MKVTAKNRIDSVYTGFLGDHDPTLCTDCKAGRPCQYTAEQPFYKVGYYPINPGDEFKIVGCNTEYVTLQDSDKFLYSVPMAHFITAFPDVEDPFDYE